MSAQYPMVHNITCGPRPLQQNSQGAPDGFRCLSIALRLVLRTPELRPRNEREVLNMRETGTRRRGAPWGPEPGSAVRGPASGSNSANRCLVFPGESQSLSGLSFLTRKTGKRITLVPILSRVCCVNEAQKANEVYKEYNVPQ